MTINLDMLIYSVLGSSVPIVLGVWAYKKKRKVDSGTSAQNGARMQQMQPINALSAALERRDAQIDKLVSDHLKKDSEERVKIIEALAAMEASGTRTAEVLHSAIASIKEAREDATRRAAKLYDKLDLLFDAVRQNK